MGKLILEQNQAALIIDVTPDGEVNVDISLPKEPDEAGDFAAAICTVIGQKLAVDEAFQVEILDELQNEKVKQS